MQDVGARPRYALEDDEPERPARHVDAVADRVGAQQTGIVLGPEDVDQRSGIKRIDVLGKSGQVLATSVPIKGGDHSRIEVKWEKGNIADLKGKLVSLRFKLNNARFYSYWLE